LRPRFIRYFRRLLRNHEKLAGIRLNSSTWSRGPTPLSSAQSHVSGAQGRANGAQGRANGAQGRASGAQGRASGAQGRWNGAQSRWSGAQGRLFPGNYSRLVPIGVAVIYFFPGPRLGLWRKGCVTKSVQPSGRCRETNRWSGGFVSSHLWRFGRLQYFL